MAAFPSDGLPENPAIRRDAALALDGGASFDREHAINVIAEACWVNREQERDLDRGGG